MRGAIQTVTSLTSSIVRVTLILMMYVHAPFPIEGGPLGRTDGLERQVLLPGEPSMSKDCV